MKKSILWTFALLLFPFLGYTQCSDTPDIAQWYSADTVWSCGAKRHITMNRSYNEPASWQDHNAIYHTRFFKQEDSLFANPLYTHTSTDQNISGLELVVPDANTLVAQFYVENDCGPGQDTLYSTLWLQSNPDFRLDSCSAGPSFIEGPQLVCEGSSEETYVLNSHALRDYIDQSEFYYPSLIWEYNGTPFYQSDTVFTVPKFDMDTNYLIVRRFFPCVCGEWTFNSNEGIVIDSIAIVVASSMDCGSLNGYAYGNANDNCTDKDFPLKKRVLKIEPGPYYAVTDDTGYYETSLPLGSYTYELQTSDVETTCDPGGVPFTLDQNNPTFSNDLVTQITGEKVTINVFNGRARPGIVFKSQVSITNHGAPVNGYLEWTNTSNEGQSLLKNVSADPAAQSTANDRVEWTPVSLGYEETQTFNVTADLQDTAAIGDWIRTLGRLYSNESQQFYSDSMTTSVRNSYDPNDIKVNLNSIEPGFTAQDTATLKYTIRFQNTGNDTAYKVVVTDTVDPLLDISTLQLGVSSHNYSFAVLEGDVFEWTFDNINLVDSTTNLEKSQGFLTFRIHPKSEMQLGDDVAQTANIYFDLNPPVITNTEVTEMEEQGCEDIPEISSLNLTGFTESCSSFHFVSLNADTVSGTETWPNFNPVYHYRIYDAGDTDHSNPLYINDSETTWVNEPDVIMEYTTGLVVQLFVSNDCGTSEDTLYADIEMFITPEFKPESCGGEESVTLGELRVCPGASGLVYRLDSPELRAFKNQGGFSNVNWYLNGQIIQDSNGVDTSIVINYFPREENYLVAKQWVSCTCTGWTQSEYVLDSIAIVVDSTMDCGVVKGDLYANAANNCTDKDYVLKERMVEIQPGPIYLVTDSMGHYESALPYGSYNISHVTRSFETACDAGGANFTLDGANPEFERDFITQLTGEDFTISVHNSRARPGFPFYSYVRIKNNSRPVKGDLIWSNARPEGGSLLENISGDPTEDQATATSLEWNTMYLDYEEVRHFKITADLKDEAELGDVFRTYAEFTSLLENVAIDSATSVVRNSYDPNDKAVNRKEMVPAELTLDPFHLKYTVQFQNTGNDVAYDVVVTDTLSELLDLSSLRLGVASHDYRLEIREGNVLVWTFEGINLPDSTSDYDGSQGFLTFFMKPLPSMSVGEVINNTVNIFFDLNEAIITNTVQTELVETVGVSEISATDHTLYPNPARSQVNLTHAVGASVQIYSADGKVSVQRSVDGNGSLDVSDLARGVYLVVVRNGMESTTHRLVKE